MAFNFKTAEDNYFNCLPSNITDAYLRDNFSESNDRFNQLGRFFAFSVNNTQKQYLNSCGIQLAPIQNATHPHPVSKMIENHLIYVCLPGHLRHMKRLILCSIKAEKADYIFHRVVDENKTMEVVNNLIENKDHFRYDPDSIIRTGYKNFSKFCSLARKRFNSPGKIKADCFFFHDEMHFWSKTDMVNFLTEVQPKCILATIVFPVEALRGFKRSMNSVAYDFEIHKDSLFFFPDGKKGQPYIQPLDCWLLSCNKIFFDSPEGICTYTVSLIESVGANHLFSICKGDLKTESHRFFRDFDLIDLRHLKNPRENWADFNLNDSRVRGWVFRKTMSYMLCLKKGDVESALAKLRQLTDSEPMPAEVIIFGELFSLLEKSKIFKQKNFLSKILSSSFYIEKIRENAPLISSLMPPGAGVWSDIVREWILQADELKITIQNGELLFDKDFNEINQSNNSSFSSYIDSVMCIIPKSLQNLLSKNESDLLNKWLNERSSPYSSSNHGAFLSFNGIESTENSYSNHLEGPISFGLLAIRRQERLFRLNNSFLTFPSDSQEEEHNSSQDNDSHIQESLSSKEEYLDRRPNSSLPNPESRRNACFLNALSSKLKRDVNQVIKQLCDQTSGASEGLLKLIEEDLPFNRSFMDEACLILGVRVHLSLANSVIKLNDNSDLRIINLNGIPGHVLMSSLPELTEINVGSIVDRSFNETYGVPAVHINSSEINLTRACSLLSCFETMNFGALIDRSKIKDGRVLDIKMLSFLENARKRGIKSIRTREIDIIPFLGFAGSGKTHGLTRDLISCGSNDFLFISPRKSLIDQVIDRVKESSENGQTCSEKNFHTFERALLLNRDVSLIILDECSIYPPGYLDLIKLKSLFNDPTSIKDLNSALNQSVRSGGNITSIECLNSRRGLKKIVVIGDVLQSSFHSGSCSKLDNLSDDLKDVISLCPVKIPYLYGTRRFGRIDNFIEIGFFSNKIERSEILLVKGLNALDDQIKDDNDSDIGFLVASRADKDRHKLDYPNVMTINESQGCSFSTTVLIVTIDFFSTKFENLIVASTRHRRRMIIVIPNSILDSIDWLFKRNKLHAGLIQKNFCVLQEEVDERLRNFHIISEIPFGSDFEIKCEGDPFLKSGLSLLKSIPFDVVEPEIISLRENLKTHVPISNEGVLNLEISSKMQAREYREFKKEGLGWSEQFKDIPNSRDKTSTNSSMLPESIFPRHQARDSLTFFAAVKKRLVFKEPLRNFQEFEAVRGRGKDMLKLFLKFIPLSRDFNQSYHEDSITEFEEKKISKSAAMIGAHHERSTTDWPINSIFLFQKSQLCTKLEKMHSEAKAGQTLACFSHNVLIRFAPLNRYIEKKVSEALPSNLYIHQRKDFSEFEEWVIKNDFSGICTESDFEAFDSSQDAYTLAFEVELMNYLGIDSSIIQDYIYIKMHLNCKLGNLAIMRFTGEFCTFLFNTLSNMLFTFMKYDVRKGDSICFAGDDMCANRKLSVKDDFNYILDKIRLKAKVGYVSNPTFCGWHLSKFGIVKNPKLIEARLKIAIQKQQVDQVIDSYFLEHIYAYRKGDNIFSILSDDLLEYHYILTRFFVLNKTKLKGKSIELFNDANEVEGGLFGEISFGNPNLVKISARFIARTAISVIKGSLLLGSIKSAEEGIRTIKDENLRELQSQRSSSCSDLINSILNQNSDGKRINGYYPNSKILSDGKGNRGLSQLIKTGSWEPSGLMDSLKSHHKKSASVVFNNLRRKLGVDQTHSWHYECDHKRIVRSFLEGDDMRVWNELQVFTCLASMYKDSKGLGFNLGVFNPNLGHVKCCLLNLRHMVEQKCQSSQLKSSLAGSKGMKRECTLTQSNHPQYIKMLRCLTKRCSLQSKGSNPQLPFQQATLVETTELTSTCLMRLNLRRLGRFQKITLLSIWELFSLVSPVFSRSTNLLKVLSSTMIQGLRIRSSLAKLVSNFQCRVGKLISCTAQIIQYQLVIPTSVNPRGLSSIFQTLGSKLTLMLSLLTLECYIGSAITHASIQLQRRWLDLSTKKSLVCQTYLMPLSSSLKKTYQVSRTSILWTLTLGRDIGKVVFSRVLVVVSGLDATQRNIRVFLSYLGQHPLGLKIIRIG